MDIPEISLDGCNALFKWVVPDNGGLPIKGITVEIKSKDKFFKLDNCGGGWPNSDTCVVNRGVFALPPFNMEKDDLVLARVYATNYIGDGPMSQIASKGIKATKLPDATDTPLLVNKGSDNIYVAWQRNKTLKEEFQYLLEWAKGTEGKFESQKEMEGISYTIPNLEKGQTYRIRYRLKNQCEQGKASPELVVSLAETPG